MMFGKKKPISGKDHAEQLRLQAAAESAIYDVQLRAAQKYAGVTGLGYNEVGVQFLYQGGPKHPVRQILCPYANVMTIERVG